jgi:hypothetical protein
MSVSEDASKYSPSDILEEGYSSAAQALLDDADYKSRYEQILAGLLSGVDFKPGDWYTNMWPVCRKEAVKPSILVLGRATRGQWAERLDRPDFPIDQAIDTAARKDMYWVDLVRSQYIRTALAIVDALPAEYRNNTEQASLDIIWSDLYKVARENNPTVKEMMIQGSLGTGELLAREVEVLQPKLVIAMTQTYSRKTKTVSRGWFEHIMGTCHLTTEDPSAAPLVTHIHGVPCVVGAHPQAGPPRDQFVGDALCALDTI